MKRILSLLFASALFLVLTGSADAARKARGVFIFVPPATPEPVVSNS